MTSETLLMNRNGISMAADSAVTVDGKKTYKGVNKLFMLSSDNPPMAMMIYGSANFENIPLETLIKEYRKKTNFEDKGDIISIKNDFLKFLGKNTPNSDFASMIESGLESFKSEIVSKMEKYDGSPVDFFKSRITYDLPDFLNDYNQIIKKYDKEFEEIIPDNIEEDNHEEIVSILKNIFFNKLIRTTGIVIAGFNTQDLFPSVVTFRLCLNNEGKIEIVDYEELINYDGCVICPFAQTDVINTFLTGIDSTMGETIVDFFSKFLDKYLKELRSELNSKTEIKKDSQTAVKQVLDKFRMKSVLRVKEFASNIADLKEIFSQPILNSVDALPKEELANMAESLVHITSLKRKVDSNLETVGG